MLSAPIPPLIQKSSTEDTVLPETPPRVTHGSDIPSEVLLFKRKSINKPLCDAPLGSSCALTWNTCVASSSLSSSLRVESWPVIGWMPMGQSLSKMEYLKKREQGGVITYHECFLKTGWEERFIQLY